ncbi:glycosyltransferase [uncultured Williamsia sp.]|uniref:glycosyltransferase n=1 Tax=uncultured Williamsia sp. TaxID=259311 RepID=UPI00260247D4|nr:glycosyltransferase [uncultured Williamsia sp.]
MTAYQVQRPAVTASSASGSVAIIGINYAPEVTGIGPYTAGLASGLSDRGFAVSVHTGVPHYPQWRKSVAPPAEAVVPNAAGGSLAVTRVNHYVPPIVTASRRARMELSFAIRSIAAGLGRPDAIVCVSPPLIAAAAMTLYGKLLRVPVGLVVQDLYSLGAIETGLARGRTSALIARIEAWSLRNATSVVVIHDRFARSVERLGIFHARMATIQNWTHVVKADPNGRIRTRAAFGWSPTEVVALHSGNMGVKQGLESVVEAARLADETNAPVRFVLVGDGNQRRSLEAMAQGVDRLTFLDPVPEDAYMAMLAAADVLLVNERHGVADMAMPSKLTSYFASGRPVLAAVDPEGATADEIARSKAGVMVPPGDPAAMVEAILDLATDTDRRETLARNGGRYAADFLGADRALDAYALWCRDLVGGAA